MANRLDFLSSSKSAHLNSSRLENLGNYRMELSGAALVGFVWMILASWSFFINTKNTRVAETECSPFTKKTEGRALGFKYNCKN